MRGPKTLDDPNPTASPCATTAPGEAEGEGDEGEEGAQHAHHEDGLAAELVGEDPPERAPEQLPEEARAVEVPCQKKTACGLGMWRTIQRVRSWLLEPRWGEYWG